MKKHSGIVVCTLTALSLPAMAQEFDRRAEIRGGDREHGRCEVIVVVDGAARIEIRRAEARLIDERGAPAVWRHFECSAEMPGDPREFAFRMLSGRGRSQLVQNPRGGSPAVIQIEDPPGGAGEYRFEIAWRGFGGDRGPGDRPFGDRPVERAWVNDDAIRNCQDAVSAQARDRFRTDRMEFRRIRVDDAPGRREWVVGELEVRRDRDRIELFRFGCSVDFGGRRIRSVDINPMDRDRDRR
jgi:hypothetical protein